MITIKGQQVHVNFITPTKRAPKVAIICPVEQEDDSSALIDDKIISIITSEYKFDPVFSIFCLLSSGEDLNLGRNFRENIRNRIYETAAKFKGIILTNGENKGLGKEIGIASEQLSAIHNDRVPILGLSTNQELLKFQRGWANDRHNGILCIKQTEKIRSNLSVIPEQYLWHQTLLSLKNIAKGTDQQEHSIHYIAELLPLVLVINSGDKAILDIVSQVALTSPLLRPSVVLLKDTGGLSEVLSLILRCLAEKLCKTSNPNYETYLTLFGERHNDLRKKLEVITNSNESFEKFMDKHGYKNEHVFDMDHLRAKIPIIFGKCFILPSDLTEDFGELLKLAMFPNTSVPGLNTTECRLRRVQVSLKVNQVDIARATLIESQKDKSFETWMIDMHIYEQFLHEAFLNNNTDFFADLFKILPRSFIVDQFMKSDHYYHFLYSWLSTKTDGESTLTIYSVVENSKKGQAQLRKIESIKDTETKASRIRSLLSGTLLKLNLDMDMNNICQGSFNLKSIRAIFVIGLITGRLEISKTVLHLSADVLGDYLVGVLICRKIGDALPHEYMALNANYEDTANYMENEAYDLLSICFKKNFSLAEKLLIRQLPHWGNKTCIELAVLSNSQNFIAHQAVQRLLKTIWRGTKNPTQRLRLNDYVSLLFPVISPLLIHQTVDEDANYIKRVLRFLHTPSTIFFYTGILKVLYLMYYAWILTMKFCKKPTPYEALLWSWTLSLYMEFMSEHYNQNKALLKFRNFWTNFRKYISNHFLTPWSTIDVISFFFFFVAFIFRLMCIQAFDSWTVTDLFDKQIRNNKTQSWRASDQNCPIFYEADDDYAIKLMKAAHYCYVFAYIFSCTKLLELCTASKNLGPKVKAVIGVINDLIVFMVILSPFVLAFGVATQSVMYMNEWRLDKVLFGVLVKPFFSMFGELFMGENTNYHFTDDVDQVTEAELSANNIEESVVCSSISQKSIYQSAQQALAENGHKLIRCPYKSNLTWLFMGLYQIIANALLLNLLIAMFSNTFNRINRDAALVWKFQQYNLLQTYHAKSPIVPPFNLLFSPLIFLWAILKKCNKNISCFKSFRLPTRIPYDGNLKTIPNISEPGFYIKMDSIEKGDVEDGAKTKLFHDDSKLKESEQTEEISKSNKLTVFESLTHSNKYKA